MTSFPDIGIIVTGDGANRIIGAVCHIQKHFFIVFTTAAVSVTAAVIVTSAVVVTAVIITVAVAVVIIIVRSGKAVRIQGRKRRRR